MRLNSKNRKPRSRKAFACLCLAGGLLFLGMVFGLSRYSDMQSCEDRMNELIDFVKEQSRDFFEPIERELSENSEPVTHRHLLDFIKRGDLEGYKHAIVEHFRLYTIYLERHKR